MCPSGGRTLVGLRVLPTPWVIKNPIFADPFELFGMNWVMTQLSCSHTVVSVSTQRVSH